MARNLIQRKVIGRIFGTSKDEIYKTDGAVRQEGSNTITEKISYVKRRDCFKLQC